MAIWMDGLISSKLDYGSFAFSFIALIDMGNIIGCYECICMMLEWFFIFKLILHDCEYSNWPYLYNRVLTYLPSD